MPLVLCLNDYLFAKLPIFSRLSVISLGKNKLSTKNRNQNTTLDV
jgi:hypothetical protein